MSKLVKFGASGVKNVKEIYIGAGGVKKVKEGYIGASGVKQFYTSNMDIVLWDGTNLQNGATFLKSDKILQYSNVAGFLSGKILVFKFKSDISNTNINIRTFLPSVTSNYYTFDPDGNVVGGTLKYTWIANKEYYIDCSNLYIPSQSIKVEFSIEQYIDVKFSEYLQYLALR